MDRLQELKQLLETEMEGDNDPRYVEDLKLSIKRLEKRLKAGLPDYELVGS